MQNHLLAGSGQVSGVSGQGDSGPLGAWVLARQELLWTVGSRCPGEVGAVERGQGGTTEGEWCGACPQCSPLCQERSGTDPTQARPNPPTFAQGVISEYRCGGGTRVVLAGSHPARAGWAEQSCG